MKRTSLDLPDDWHKAVKQAALDAGYNSSAEYIRHWLAQSPDIRQAAIKAGITELSPLSRDWGGKRDKISNTTSQAASQDEQDDKISEDNLPLPEIEPTKGKVEQDREIEQDRPIVTKSDSESIGLSPAEIIRQRKLASAGKGLLPVNGKR